ncbi:MAG: hypothetical protein L6Q51_12905 [Cyclobacteriaceae bacterium]|nr:hypothetical protein [Cyclobacteriaceae bacterium]
MINRYAGEIHLNPVPILRHHDFNNEGEIPDIIKTLDEAILLTTEINTRLAQLKKLVNDAGLFGRARFNFSPGGYISITGLPDEELKELYSQGLIELFDFATDRDWVKRYGHLFGLVWENGRAVEVE